MSDQSQFVDNLTQSHRLIAVGDCEGAMRFAKLAFVVAREEGDAEALARSLSQMAWCCMLLGTVETGLECAVAARRLLSRHADLAELSRIQAIEALLLLDTGLSDDAFDMATLAVATAKSCNSSSAMAFALSAKGVALTLCRQLSMAVPLLQQSVAIAEAVGLAGQYALSLLNLGFCHIKLAEEAEAREDAPSVVYWREKAIATTGEAIAAAEACGDLWVLRAALGNCAEFHALNGNVAAAIAHLERSASLPGDGGTSLRIHYLYTLATARLRSGDLAGALEAARDALALADETGQIDHQVNVATQLGRIYEALGQFEDALALQKRFHALYVRQSGETTQKLARVAELRAENSALRARADALAAEALLDALTGLPNRRSFERMVVEMAGRDYALAIIDLDHFKAVNDQYSHLVGDDVLRRVSRTLEAHVMHLGHAARLGGEEFVVLLPDCDTQRAVVVLDELRLSLREIDWSDIARGLRTTASVGVCSTAEVSHHDEMMISADLRLYAAKARGRDCTVWFDPDGQRHVG